MNQKDPNEIQRQFINVRDFLAEMLESADLENDDPALKSNLNVIAQGMVAYLNIFLQDEEIPTTEEDKESSEEDNESSENDKSSEEDEVLDETKEQESVVGLTVSSEEDKKSSENDKSSEEDKVLDETK